MRLQYTLGASALLLFLTACGGPHSARVAQSQPAAETPAPVAQSAPAAEENVSTRIRISRAVRQLQAGDDYSARQDLEAVLATEPDNAVAKSLMEQIDGDPQSLFGAESFNYTVKVGESLSLLSERYLDDRLKFYGLARYNNIPNPSLIEAGEVIRIPGTAPAAVAAAVNTMPAPAAGPAPTMAPAMAAATVSAGDCAASIPALEQQVKTAPTDDSRKQLLRCYSKEADALAEAGRYDEAQRTLQKAIMVDRTDTAITQQLVALVGKARTEELYQKGADEAATGKLEEANTTLSELMAKHPDHARGKQLLTEVRGKLAERYHSMAMSLYNRQQVDRALALWDRVLELDPQHAGAMEYSAKARAAKN